MQLNKRLLNIAGVVLVATAVGLYQHYSGDLGQAGYEAPASVANSLTEADDGAWVQLGGRIERIRLLGIDEKEARRIGLDVYKVGMVWPLEHDGALDFVHRKREVLVVEEKRGIIESWFKEYFYDYPGRKPERMVGKYDEDGEPLVPWVGELHPILLAGIVARRLDAQFPGLNLTARADRLRVDSSDVIQVAGATRMPYFCSGCPHNTSTKVPEGSKALAGIGCHFMASWMDRETDGLIQMGGEGVNWIARSKFNGDQHVFQNLGDGTFYHSGSLAIRQAIAAGTKAASRSHDCSDNLLKLTAAVSAASAAIRRYGVMSGWSM